VESFSGWQNQYTLDCTYPPCMAPLDRPISQVGAINVYETVASSVYNGATISLTHHLSKSLQFKLGYTWAEAIDDGQDTVSAGSPATVQNSYAPGAERALSSINQRHRFVGAAMWEPRAFTRDQNLLRAMLNDWKLSSVFMFGSGRPVTANVIGDANADGNTENDRLPGYRRNAFTGPNYMTDDLRITRIFHANRRPRVQLLAESFNLLNRDNQRLNIDDSGFDTSAAMFVQTNKTVSGTHYPAHFEVVNGFMKPTTSFAPRQVQFALRFLY